MRYWDPGQKSFKSLFSSMAMGCILSTLHDLEVCGTRETIMGSTLPRIQKATGRGESSLCASKTYAKSFPANHRERTRAKVRGRCGGEGGLRHSRLQLVVPILGLLCVTAPVARLLSARLYCVTLFGKHLARWLRKRNSFFGVSRRGIRCPKWRQIPNQKTVMKVYMKGRGLDRLLSLSFVSTG